MIYIPFDMVENVHLLSSPNNRLIPDERETVNRSMCHDPKTALRFYVVGQHVTAEQGRNTRLRILRPLGGPWQPSDISEEESKEQDEEEE